MRNSLSWRPAHPHTERVNNQGAFPLGRAPSFLRRMSFPSCGAVKATNMHPAIALLLWNAQLVERDLARNRFHVVRVDAPRQAG